MELDSQTCIKKIKYKRSNLFVFMTPSIVNIGGAQLYVSRKKEYLESLGWQVLILSCVEGKITIPGLRDSETLIIPMLRMPLSITSESKRAKVIKGITLPMADSIVVESHTIYLSIWAEYIFKERSVKKICYPLMEAFPHFSEDEMDYLRFKLDQKLLYGISIKSIPSLLGNNLPYNTQLSAVGSSRNNVDDRAELEERIPKADYTILSLGRLDKPYIPYAFNAVKQFASKNAAKQINLILIGSNNYNAPRDFSVELENLNVIKMGSLFPIPRKIFQCSDVAIASAGSVLVCARERVPTIAIDANDYKAIGVYYKTTNHSIFRDSEPPVEIENLLHEILIEKKHKDIPIEPIPEPDYSRHLEIIEQAYDTHAVFDVTRMKLGFKKKCVRILYSVLGLNLLTMLFDIKSKRRSRK